MIEQLMQRALEHPGQLGEVLFLMAVAFVFKYQKAIFENLFKGKIDKPFKETLKMAEQLTDALRGESDKKIDILRLSIMAREIFGRPIRTEILNEIHRLGLDVGWMVEKYFAAGGERVFRWDDSICAIRPAPVGLDVSETKSFNKLLKSSTNAAIWLLFVLCGFLALSLAGFWAYLKKPDAPLALNGLRVGGIFLLFSLFIIASIRSFLNDEARYKAANAFWTTIESAKGKVDAVSPEKCSGESGGNIKKKKKRFRLALFRIWIRVGSHIGLRYRLKSLYRLFWLWVWKLIKQIPFYLPSKSD